MKSTFEKMGGTYTLGADGIYYPNLVSTDEDCLLYTSYTECIPDDSAYVHQSTGKYDLCDGCLLYTSSI